MHTFNPSLSSAGMIENHLVVFVGDAPINAAFLAVDAQRYGAAALILKKMDDVCSSLFPSAYFPALVSCIHFTNSSEEAEE